MSNEIQARDLKGQTLRRSFELETRAINKDDRTVDLAFSSETPVDRGFFIEILDHDPKSIRLGRMEDGAPLLVDHDRSVQVGVVERGSASIDADRTGRARVRFGRAGRSDEEFQMVVDSIRTKVSVGYMIHAWEETRGEKGQPDTVRVTDWEPIEISLVALPADSAVGIGRNLSELTETVMTDETTTIEATPAIETRAAPEETRVDIVAERESAVRAANEKNTNRIKRIQDAAKLYPSNDQLRTLADGCIADGTSLEDFQSRAMPLIGQSQASITNDRPVTELGMERSEVERFSILRAVRAIADMSSGGKHWSKAAPFEHECTRAVEDAVGRESRGLFVPYDVQKGSGWMNPGMRGYRDVVQRAAPMDVTENVDLVATDHLAGSFIEALRAEAVVMQAGARMLGGLVGNVDIPRNDTPAVFGWIAEDADSADTEIVTGTVALAPKTVSGSVPITRRLRKQSSPDVEALVRQDLVQGAALAIDLGALSGTGAAGQPTGVTVIAGTGTSTIAAAGVPTWVETVEFETDVAAANGLRGSLMWITTPAVMGSMKTTSKDAGSGRFIMENGEVNGYGVLISTQLAANTIIFGSWPEVLIGMWGVLDIRVDTATNAAKDRTTIRAFQDIDIGIRHAASFSKNA